MLSIAPPKLVPFKLLSVWWMCSVFVSCLHVQSKDFLLRFSQIFTFDLRLPFHMAILVQTHYYNLCRPVVCISRFSLTSTQQHRHSTVFWVAATHVHRISGQSYWICWESIWSSSCPQSCCNTWWLRGMVSHFELSTSSCLGLIHTLQ